jgi:DNA-directed RNA polymerase subunit RPC12/RpoP
MTWKCDECGAEAFPGEITLYRGMWLCEDCHGRLSVAAPNGENA